MLFFQLKLVVADMRYLVLFVLCLSFGVDVVFSAHFRDGGFLAENGVLESIQIEPRLPATGEAFTVRLIGSWPEINPDSDCLAPPGIDQVVVYPGNRVQIVSNLEQDSSYCDQPSVRWNVEAGIPASAWDAVDEGGFLLVEHLMFSGINMLTGVNQVFDMRLGTHEVPAYVGSGFWISMERPFEGVMIEQQGGRTLFYNLGYDRDENNGDDGEPVWLMFSGDMIGNSTLARAYRYDWPLELGLQPGEAPPLDLLHTKNDSGSIIVNDYNHLRVMTAVSNNRGLYQDYIRYYFGRGSSRVPVYVPPLGGRWTLHGFDYQDSAFEANLELLEATSPAANQYRFDSVGGDWMVLCTVVPPGTGECSFTREADNLKFEFSLPSFQGNLARGNLQHGDGDSLDGVLVRNPWRLPVLDIDF